MKLKDYINFIPPGSEFTASDLHRNVEGYCFQGMGGLVRRKIITRISKNVYQKPPKSALLGAPPSASTHIPLDTIGAATIQRLESLLADLHAAEQLIEELKEENTRLREQKANCITRERLQSIGVIS